MARVPSYENPVTPVTLKIDIFQLNSAVSQITYNIDNRHAQKIFIFINLNTKIILFSINVDHAIHKVIYS